ncbi:MAG: TonB-dependent receptor [Terriglobia bacterium]
MTAQVGMATLSGTITDPSGAVIPGAQVTLANVTEKAERHAVTTPSGQYVIPAILPGTYQLQVRASGFQPRTLTGVILTSGQGSTLNVTLGLSEAVQQVTVKEAPPLLQTTTAAVGGEVTGRQFTSLPMLGRNFTSLIVILPGVANVPNADQGYASSGINGAALVPAVYGQRQRDNSFTVDGVTNLEPNFTRLGLLPPPEAIAEMKVETANDSGAYGWASGASINLVTKSGTNQYHGDAWEYLRNGALDARSYFLPNVGAFQWNQFGFAGGGPLVIPHILSKKKAWYVFGWYEGVRIHQAANYTALVPTAAQLSGDFSGSPAMFNPYTTITGPTGNIVSRQAFSQNQIPSGLLNSIALTLAKAIYPAPNFSGVIPGKNFLNTTPVINTSDQWSGRVDHQFGAKDSFYARYSDWRNPLTSVTLPAVPSDTYSRWTNSVASDTHTFSPTFLVTGRFGLQRVVYNQFSEGPNLSQQTGLVSVFPPYHGFDFLPSLNIPGYPALSEFYGNQGPEYFLTWTGDAQKISGRHTIAFGGGYVRDSYFADHTAGTEDFGTGQTAFGAGTGSSLASFLLGLPLDASRQAGITGGHFLFHNYSLYLQDTFRATPKLTLNLGLRWDYISPPMETPGLGTFDWNTGTYFWDTTNPITGAPANIRRGLVPPDYNGWQPRIGVAYALTPKTVVRSSYGIFDNIFGSNQQSYTGSRGDWPFAFEQSLGGLNTTTPDAFLQSPFPGPPVGSRTPLGCGQCANIQPSSSRQPYVQEWSFSLQRQLTPSTMVEADYFGSHGVKLSGQVIDNVATVPSPVGSYKTRQRWPQFPPYIMNNFNEFMSWYDGLSLKFERHYSKNLSLIGSYTWSKTLDQSDSLGNGGVYGLPDYNPTRFNISSFKAPAGFDVRNILSLAYIYDLPWKTSSRWVNAAVAGWELSGIVSYGSGIPYYILLSTDNENIGVVPGRISEFPNLACNPETGFTRSAKEWFNTACYQLPQFGTQGNAGRHALFSDPIANWDSAIVKRWPLGENRNLEFRAEFFNFLNASTFDPPVSQFGPELGTVSTTGRQPGRQVQFALKLHF